MKYRPEVDGLRAVAVLPVILFHAGFERFAGGFVGVDVFFVISGYLITSIILEERSAGKFTLLGFYERRARRILPALFLVILCCVPFAWLWMLPIEFKDFGASLVATSLFSSNILFWLQTGYFEGASELKPLLHTWSLAVEEQYYLLFPLFLLVTWRLGKGRVLLVLGAVALASLAAAQWGSTALPDAAFYLLPTRGWELLIGVFVAYFLAGRTRDHEIGWGGEAFSIIGIGLILYAVFAFDEATPFPGLYALVPTIGTVLVIVFGVRGTLVGRFLSLKPILGVGLISYGMYLWHQPLFAFARIRSSEEPTTATYLMLVGVAFVLAYLSWKYIESYFRNRRNRGFRATVLLPSALAVAFCAVGVDAQLNYEKQRIRTLVFGGEYTERFLTVSEVEVNQRMTERAVSRCRFTVRRLTAEAEAQVTRCFETHGRGVLILGDSHAIDLFGAVVENHSSQFVIGVANGGCRPHTNYAYCHYDAVGSFVRDNDELFDFVIYNQAGFYLLLDEEGDVGTRSMFSALGLEDSVPLYRTNETFIKENIAYLSELAEATEVAWLGPRFEPHLPVKQSFLRGDCSLALRPNQYQNFVNLDETIDRLVTESGASIAYVSQIEAQAFDPSSDLASCDAGIVYWSDGDHWSDSGERRFGKLVLSALEEQARLR